MLVVPIGMTGIPSTAMRAITQPKPSTGAGYRPTVAAVRSGVLLGGRSENVGQETDDDALVSLPIDVPGSHVSCAWKEL